MSLAFAYAKDPDEVLDYDFDWSAWLGTDEIATSTWTVSSGLTKDSQSNSATATKVWVSGGTDGQTYTLTNTITTDGDRTAERTAKLKVKER